jgi:hypothetical protein
LSNNAICSRRDAVQGAMQQALQRRGYERPLDSCYAELGRGSGLLQAPSTYN